MGLKRAAHEDASREHLSGAPTASDEAPSKRAKFDHRNPSTLAANAPDEDAVLELDEIGRAGLTAKRNAVKLEGYDSDSSQENFDARAEDKARSLKKAERDAQKSKDEEDADMFADVEEDEVGPDGDDDEDLAREAKKRKEVRFMDDSEIEGQVGSSKAGGHVSADFSIGADSKGSKEEDESSSDASEGGDERRDELDEDVDEELGAGGKKKHAPRLDAFHMRNEAEEGRFDQSGNFVRNAKDPFEVHDAWLEGNSNKNTMRKAAEAEEQREMERRERNMKDDAVSTGELLAQLIVRLETEETALEALQRLGRGKREKKTAFKKNKRKGEMEGMEEVNANGTINPAEEKRRKKVEALTSAADALLTRGQPDIYDRERGLLERQYKRETGEAWKDPEPDEETLAHNESNQDAGKMWHYRWADARDGGDLHGPYDGPTMRAWDDAGYFGEGVEFRQDGLDGWGRSVDFV